MNKSKSTFVNKKSGGARKQSKPRAQMIQRREVQKRPMSGPTVAPARFSTLANGDIRVTRREYLEAILAPSSVFDVTSSHLNPGKEIFHWLSQVADNYEEYVFEKLSFEYKPVISSATYSGSMGSIVVAVLYNAGAVTLDTYAKMVEYSGAIEKRICDPLVMKVNVSKDTHAGEDHYIRTHDVPIGEDIKTYDIGKLLVATDHVSASFPAGTLLGHLYADYSVVLKKPKLKVNTVAPAIEYPFGNWQTTSCALANVENGLLGLSLNTIPANFSTDPTNDRKLILTVPEPGRYHLIFSATLTANSTATVGIPFGVNYIPISCPSGDLNTDTISDTITPYEFIFMMFFESAFADAEITFVPTTSPTEFSGFNMLLMGVPAGAIGWG